MPHNNRNALARAGERENRNLRTANTAMICRRQYSTVCAAAQPLRSIRRLGNAGTGGCHATALAGECEVRNARDTVVIIHHRDETRLADAFGSHHTQNRTEHMASSDCNPREQHRESERETAGERKSGRNSCAARREHKCKESALALRSYPVLPFHALFVRLLSRSHATAA